MNSIAVFSLLVLGFCITVDSGPTKAKKDCKCGQFTTSRMYNGYQIQEGEFPWMITIHFKYSNGTGRCGAALIAPTFGVTAGHCVTYYHNNPEDPTYVRFWPSGDTIPVKKINLVGDNTGVDIALFELDFPSNVTPICLPPIHQKFVGVNATMVGYGETESGAQSDVPLGGVVTIPSNKNCSKVLNASGGRAVVDKEICGGAYGGQPAFCTGDSGSPLMYYNETQCAWNYIGAVSTSYSCSANNTYGIFTRISSYVSWIQNVTGNAGCQKAM